MMKILILVVTFACSNALAVTMIEWKSGDEIGLSQKTKKRILQAVVERCEIFGNGLKELKIDHYYPDDEDVLSITLSTSVRIAPGYFKDMSAVSITVFPDKDEKYQVGTPTGLEAARCKFGI